MAAIAGAEVTQAGASGWGATLGDDGGGVYVNPYVNPGIPESLPEGCRLQSGGAQLHAGSNM